MAIFAMCLLTANTSSFSTVVSSALLPMECLYQELSVDVSHLCWIQFFQGQYIVSRFNITYQLIK